MERTNWKKDFGLLWAGQAASVLTSSILQMALIWTLTMETQSAMILSLASLAGFLPNALLGPFAGAVVDRVGRKKAMIGADLFISAVSLILVFISAKGTLPVWIVLAVLAIRSVGTSFHTPAISATAPLIVPSDQLMKCAGYTHSLQTIGYIAGTALAGVLYPIWSLGQLVFLDVIGAFIASLAVLAIKIPKVKKAETITSDSNLWREMKEAYTILHQEKGLFAILWTAALFMILYSPINALFPLLSTDYFKGTTWHCAVVEIAYSIGMLVGSICIGLGMGMKRKGLFLISAVAMMGIPIALIGILPTSAFGVFAALSVVMGLSVPFYNAPGTALYQEKIAPEYLGRVFGLYGSVCSLAMPIGLVFLGLWADKVGINRWFLISGVLIILISLLMLSMKSIRDIDVKKYSYVDLRQKPELKEEAAAWFHAKWNVPQEAYLECMEAYLNHETEYGWYLCLDSGRIAGGLGVIENDFHDRKDLAPNVCAVYTEPEYRGQGIAGQLLDMAVVDMKSKGITPIYLITDHTGFYERYGWEFLCMVQGDNEPHMTRMYIHR